jgi:hypothetical protein
MHLMSQNNNKIYSHTFVPACVIIFISMHDVSHKITQNDQLFFTNRHKMAHNILIYTHPKSHI